ncbi:GH116 family glycosyl-hydrolase [Lederbergia citri]|uniref:Uncharacterized protein n=1 Tax=Lederbergia citri TaxID=2833580 RepID=A0A942TKF1_9BACI|nr:GH116 family glycosyl-hydrolase [Lederbergia citri]MBS4197609.1 hypothetical protein [Lederbergia citri]
MTSENKNDLYLMEKDFVRKGNNTNHISFPLGGIGSGSIGLAGNGRLIDWEIFNRPNKNSYNGFSFFAIKAEHQGEVRVAKVINSDINPPFTGSGNGKFRGYGFGVEREAMSGFPHFESSTFKGEFPFAEIDFMDSKTPLDVKLTAFNPLIPLNDKDSSLPVAIFLYEVINQSNEELEVSITGNLTNPFKKEAVNQYKDYGDFKSIKLYSNYFSEEQPEYGDLTLSTDGDDVSYQSYWYRGEWFDNLTVFWKDFNSPGRFKERNYNEGRGAHQVATYNYQDVCLLSNHKTLRPGEKKEFRFIISWNFPNYVNFWNVSNCSGTDNCDYPSWKNYYATLFEDSVSSTKYVWSNLTRLYEETAEFKETLFNSTFPDYIIDSISSNISILKTPTVARLSNGTLYGFEGCHAEEGCCEGSCTHVWNYEQVTPFLFPSLARSMRNVDYKETQFENGKMAFRLMLPVGTTLTNASNYLGHKRAAADGQMGGVIKTYREWKISGDTEWLKSIWKQVKKALEFAWEPSNTDWWDRDKDGVMEGIQHHTLDVEMYGPNTYITGLYHTALLAAAEMADAIGDNDGNQYRELYNTGKAWVDQNLFNGEYFFQQIDLQDERFPIDLELGEIKYQVGNGCHIDQVIGQWHAHVVGLGYIFDPDKVKSALKSIYNYNFIDCMRDYANACRIYALNDEQGLVIATWPHGDSPKVPVPYADETMNGFEYQAACHMIYEGFIDEGLNVVKAVRHRYDGYRRNPWNEFECGSNYARSMASYSFLLALSGFEYDMVNGHIGFSPIINQDNFCSFWSLNQGWGDFRHQDGHIQLNVKKGNLYLKSFKSDLFTSKEIKSVFVGEQKVKYTKEGHTIKFFDKIVVDINQPFQIQYL